MSYKMFHLTELSCHTITFAIFCYVNKCQSGAYSPTLFSSGGKGTVSPLIKYGGIFFQKLFMADAGQILLGRFIG